MSGSGMSGGRVLLAPGEDTKPVPAEDPEPQASAVTRTCADVLFAPTLRHQDHRFYLTCTNAAPGQGKFIVSTTDPTGDWSDTVRVNWEVDPSLQFADDT